jgi:hypothetical protein
VKRKKKKNKRHPGAPIAAEVLNGEAAALPHMMM